MQSRPNQTITITDHFQKILTRRLNEIIFGEDFFEDETKLDNEKAGLRSGDIQQFLVNFFFEMNATDIQFATFQKELLTNFLAYHPDLIIRNFFPQAQLTDGNIDFLKKCEIYIRSEQGLHTYYHSGRNQELTRYEIKLSFLSLFLLIQFGTYLRVFGAPNAKQVGLWEAIIPRFMPGSPHNPLASYPYTVEITPPSQFIGNTFEQLAQISALGVHFNLLSPRPELLGIVHSTKSYLIHFHESIQESIKTLYSRSIAAFENIHDALLDHNKNTVSEEKIHPAPKEEKIEEIVLSFTSLSESSLKLNYPVDSKNLADRTFANFYILLNTFLLAKNACGLIASKSQAHRYENSSFKKNLAISMTEVAIWRGLYVDAEDLSVDNFIEQVCKHELKKLADTMICPGGFSSFSFMRTEFEILAENYNNLANINLNIPNVQKISMEPMPVTIS